MAREAICRHFEPLVLPMDAYSLSRLPTEKLIVFVASTTGQVSALQINFLGCCCGHTQKATIRTQGELPNNMRSFWGFLLRKSLPADSLSAVQYAVFGLGDSGEQASPMCPADIKSI